MLTIIAFDLGERGAALAANFSHIYEGQGAPVPLHATIAVCPSWVVGGTTFAGSATKAQLEARFPRGLSFEVAGEFFIYDWESVSTDQSLLLLAAPAAMAEAWALARHDVHVVPGPFAHRLWGERFAQIVKVMEATEAGATVKVALRSLFPIVVSDNVRRLAAVAGASIGALEVECFKLPVPEPKADVLVVSPEAGATPPTPTTPAAAPAVPAGPRAACGDVVIGLHFDAAPHILRVGSRKSAEFIGGALVLAPVGAREAGVGGASLAQGFASHFGSELFWIGGESGLVGARSVHPSGPEAPYTCIGRVLAPHGGTALNVRDLAIKPVAVNVTVPVVAVGATSGECSQALLAARLVEHLAAEGFKVATVRATGCAGSAALAIYEAAGAKCALDCVDAGLPSSFVPSEEYRRAGPVLMRAAEDAGADVVVVEMGADVIWACNPELLKLDVFAGPLAALFLVADDALSAFGGAKWLSERFPLVAPKARLVTDPVRGLRGSKKRFSVLGLAEPLNSGDVKTLCSIFSDKLTRKAV